MFPGLEKRCIGNQVKTKLNNSKKRAIETLRSYQIFNCLFQNILIFTIIRI